MIYGHEVGKIDEQEAGEKTMEAQGGGSGKERSEAKGKNRMASDHISKADSI